MTIDFAGRSVIVTGAGNGMGRAHALTLGRLGASVVVNDLGAATDGQGASSRAADFVVREIVSSGGRAVASHASVAHDDGCQSIAATALDAFGRIDAVIHNAGILRNATFDQMTDERFLPVLETHLLGSFFLSRAVWPTMVDQGYGRMVFTSSNSGMWGRVEGANYGAAKAGIVGLCNVLALEGASHGILCNALMPVGMTRLGGGPEASDTSDAAIARRADALTARTAPDWVAPMAVFLASETCDRTHRYYSAIRGRYAEIFVGVAQGWVAPGNEPPTVNDILDHLDTIEDRERYFVPTGTFDEIRIATEQVTAATSG